MFEAAVEQGYREVLDLYCAYSTVTCHFKEVIFKACKLGFSLAFLPR